MTGLTIEQAVYAGEEPVARSPGFRDDRAAADAIRGYGVLTDGQTALFTQPLRRGTGVFRVRGSRFHVLAVPTRLYRALHDPFAVAEQLPAEFTATGEMRTLAWDIGPPPPRELSSIQSTLQSDDGPTLLGAAQALVDGGRVVFERDQSDSDLLQQLWSVLPDANRAELTVATFAAGNALGFDVLVSPSASGREFDGYVTDAQAGDYPEGRYELALQSAAESGDETAVRALLARPSGTQSLRFAFKLLFTAVAAGVAVRVIPWEKFR